MKTIAQNINNLIEIKNSKFICYIYKINSSDVECYIDDIKKLHPKATHYCYGYKYDDVLRSSDDGEPSGTAGTPIINVIEKEELNHVLVVVVRYFGGIKLGAGGLVRAYTKAVTEALKLAKFSFLIKGYKISIHFKYSEEKTIDYILKDSLIIKKNYNDMINYECLIDDDVLHKLSNYNVSIIENLYIEK